MYKPYLEMPLEQLLAKALFELKAAANEITSADVVGSAHERIRLAAWAAGMHEDINLRQAVSALSPIIKIVEHQLEAETVGTQNFFNGTIDPEGDDIGEVVAMRILTERGEVVNEWYDRLRRLRHVLEVIEVRLAAQDAVDFQKDRLML